MEHPGYKIRMCPIWPEIIQLFRKLAQYAGFWIIVKVKSVGLLSATYCQCGYLFPILPDLFYVRLMPFFCNLWAALRSVMRLELKTLELSARSAGFFLLKNIRKNNNNQYSTIIFSPPPLARCFRSVSITILSRALWVRQLLSSSQTRWWATLSLTLSQVALLVRFVMKSQTFAATVKKCLLIGATNNFDCCLRFFLSGGFALFRGQNV